MNHSILNTIGNTPLVEIERLNPNPKVKIFAKLEYFNPGGSVKDRPALYMIQDGEASGRLTHEKTVIEATSGNTGIGLALICSVKGYPLLLTMSEAVSQERQKILKARGAEILFTPGHLGTDGAIEEVYRLSRENPKRYFMADQFNNPANWHSHFYGTAEEIWQQTEGRITHLVATMGTSGTLMGLSRRLKACNPDIRVVGVEPYLGHKIQGLKNMKEAYRPEIFEKKHLDEKVNIEDEEAFEMARCLARDEGLLVGMSSGAAFVIAQQVVRSIKAGVLVVIFPDGGERYLSTPLFAVKEKAKLRLFNTITRNKELFEPHLPGQASVYSCGPTAHDRMHLGECRRFIFSDLLCRYLEFRGYAVQHVMNITDLDDKTIFGSEDAGEELLAFTDKHVDAIKKDLHLLGIRPAAEYPRASQHVDDMVDLAKKLRHAGFAYEKLRSLYFNIARIPEYGKLSGIDIQKIKLGATVDLDEYEKDNPRDFTLLKRSRLSELKRGIFFKTEWGNVRPSWHLQCAAMALKYLGERYDIHTSSRDLIFPHHENQIAISTAITGHPLAKYWIHSERVMVDEMPEGISQKDPLHLGDVVQMGFSGREIRSWLLSNHYRKPLTFSKSRLEATRRSLNRLDACVHGLVNGVDGKPYPEIDQLIYDIRYGFITAMDDDLNISAAMASVFKIIKRINLLVAQKQIDPENAQKIVDAFRQIDTALNIFAFDPTPHDSEVTKLLKQRETERRANNWAAADQIRDRLIAMGVQIRDQKVRGDNRE